MEPNEASTDIGQSIAQKLGLNGLTADEQVAIFEQMGAVVFQNALVRAVVVMTPEDKADLELLIESGADTQALILFLQNRVPNFESWVGEEAEKVREQLLRMTPVK